MTSYTSTTTPSLLDAALSYLHAGRSVLPIAPGSKKPSVINQTTGEIVDLAWKRYQSRQPTEAQVRTWFPTDALMGLGIACGPVSGVTHEGVRYALEILDVDDEPTLAAFIEAAHWQGLSELLARLLHQRTPGGAGHYAYLCPLVQGNTVLAKRSGDVDAGEPKAVTLIETRGRGGQAVVAPTPPGIHPDRPERGYELVCGSWEALPLITPDERHALFDLARSFNRYIDPQQVHSPRGTAPPNSSGARPGDRLNETADLDWWRALLERHGWTRVHQRGDIMYWQRPGKEGRDWSATLGACGPYFYVFSSNAAPFEPEHAYPPFSAYALLEHGGDFQAAARVFATQHQQRNGQAPLGTQDQAAAIGSKVVEEDSRPVIRISTEMTAVVDAMQQAILEVPSGPVLFQRARRLCHITRGRTPPDWLDRALDAPVIAPAAPAYLRELASQTAQWQKLDKRANRWEPALPPPWTVETLQARASWPFPPLTGIVHAPTMRPDGSLLTTPGYDAATGLYLDTGGVNYPKVRSRPTLDDARSAIGHLQEAFCDFPWAHKQHDFSATLAALLSLVARYAIQGNVPLFAVRSTTRASGKGLLVDTISIIATGRHAPRWAQTLDEDEEHKRLVTVGLAGDLTIHIDNVAHPLGTGPLDLAITAETISGRILGTQKEIEVPMHVVFFASGNNMVFKGDMARRVVPIDLDPRMERPEERDNFTHPLLLSWVLEKRPRLLAAALTILRAYVEAGRPAQGVKPLGSFEQWSMLVRQALLWAGEPDPCAGRQNIEAESDENFEKFASLLETWYVCYQTTAKTLASVIYDASSKAVEIGPRNEWNDLRDALGAFDAKYDGKRPLGKPVSYALRAWKGRVIASKRLVSAGKEHHAAQWQIELF